MLQAVKEAHEIVSGKPLNGTPTEQAAYFLEALSGRPDIPGDIQMRALNQIRRCGEVSPEIRQWADDQSRSLRALGSLEEGLVGSPA